MSDCKSKAFPCQLGVNKASTIDKREFEDTNLYREIVEV